MQAPQLACVFFYIHLVYKIYEVGKMITQQTYCHSFNKYQRPSISTSMTGIALDEGTTVACIEV